jgi:iron complex transport system permease protein
VRVELVRMVGMLVASLVTAVIVSFLGIIGFVGLVCPHIVRRIIGDDHRFLLPASVLTGACLLLAADTAARLLCSPPGCCPFPSSPPFSARPPFSTCSSGGAK